MHTPVDVKSVDKGDGLGIDVDGHERRSSPLESPVLEKIVPPVLNETTPKKVKQESPEPLISVATLQFDVEATTESTEEIGQAAESRAKSQSPVSDHTNSLLALLKGSDVKSTSPPTVPVENPLLSTLKGDEVSETAVHQPPKESRRSRVKREKITQRQSRSKNNSSPSTPEVLQGPTSSGTTPPVPKSPSAAVREQSHQKSNLSIDRTPSTPPLPAPPASSSATPSPTAFNFSKEPQTGKRIQFRDILVPGGIQDPPAQTKTNGTIDLSKMTLLKRPPQANVERETVQESTRVQPFPVNVTSFTPGPIKRTPVRSRPTRRSPRIEESPESPMGVEFPFRKRTPSKGDVNSPAPTPTKSNVQSLLSILKPEPSRNEPPIEPAVTEEAPRTETTYEKQDEGEMIGTEREMKLVAMLERALARGVPS
jgi:hypothetical protein